ncbi:hypothetical protein AA313_de0208654 [Arthrobotrys entomopaga]|nr:hypothetical protein AA313_de0208654 [Arthrobotrys entomopaga]
MPRNKTMGNKMDLEMVLTSESDVSVESASTSECEESSYENSTSDISSTAMSDTAMLPDSIAVENSACTVNLAVSNDTVNSVDSQNDMETILQVNSTSLRTAVESPKCPSKQASLGSPETSACSPDVSGFDSPSNYLSPLRSLDSPSSKYQKSPPFSSTSSYDPTDPEYFPPQHRRRLEKRRKSIPTSLPTGKKKNKNHKVTSPATESSAMGNENSDGPARRGRKRKATSSTTSLDPPTSGKSDEAAKPKRVKVTDGRKAPACKRCYQKHIACDRMTETESCGSCSTKGFDCEPNDIKTVKGRRGVKEEPTMSVESGETEGIVDELRLHHILHTCYWFVGTLDSPQASIANKPTEEDLMAMLPKQVVGNEEEEEIYSSVREEGGGASENTAGMGATNGLVQPTEQECEVAHILVGMGEEHVELLDLSTSISYFRAVEEALERGYCGESGSADDVRQKLSQLKDQYLWLDRFRVPAQRCLQPSPRSP